MPASCHSSAGLKNSFRQIVALLTRKKVAIESCCGPETTPQRQVLLLDSAELSRKAVTDFDICCS